MDNGQHIALVFNLLLTIKKKFGSKMKQSAITILLVQVVQ